MSQPNRNVELLGWIGFWLVIITLAALVFGEHALNQDEGVVLNNAWQLWQGLQLYNPVVDFTAPGATYLVYWTWLIIGVPSYGSAKVAVIFIWLLSALGITQLVLRCGGKAIAVMMSVVGWLIMTDYYPLINHNALSSMAAIWLLVWLIERRYVLTGVAVAITILFLQTKGILLAAMTIVSVLVFDQSRQRAWFNVRTVVLTATALLVVALLPWSLLTIIESWFILPFTQQYLASSFVQMDIIMIEIILVLISVILAWRAKSRAGWILAASQLALFLSSAHIIDRYHLLINSFPVLVQLIVAVTQYWQTLLQYLPRWQQVLLNDLIIVAIGSLFIMPIHRTFQTATIFLDEATTYQTLRFPEMQSAQYIYAGPFLPSLYFELRKPNPFVFSNNMTLCSSACQQATLAVFQTVQPEFVILDYDLVAKYGYAPWSQPIDRYIQSHYIQCQSLGPNLLLLAQEHCPRLYPKM
ncbi:MAG: hypothetical protein HYV33_06525 [Candidatus Kerfeldbacteria bacterium]|nr:hypothetical protein [Candidatus Kerfeldbacteria bacterium]